MASVPPGPADGSPHPRAQAGRLTTGPDGAARRPPRRIARKIASDELNERVDRGLIALLRPYMDDDSLCGDERSGDSLMPSSASPTG